ARVVYHHTWNPFAPSRATVRYTVHNVGNTRVAASEVIGVEGVGGAGATSTPSTDLPELLPGSVLERETEVTGVWPLVRLTAHVDLAAQGVGLGGAPLEPMSLDASTWAVPWLLLALVAVVVTGGLLLGSRTPRRRRA